MNAFGPSFVQTSQTSLDPTKHVNYAIGMVLGADDLSQEFAYHHHRDQWILRDLLGYGTVWGLDVQSRDNGAPRGPEIVVSAGVAVDPRGRLIRVAPAQCASLNEWMLSRTEQIAARRLPTATPNVFTLPLYLVLSYRDCLTDLVPIAGEPCRSESDSIAPSRVTDDFLLELTFEPPPQQEEDAVRQFVQWLWDHVTLVDSGTASLSVDAFISAIRAAANAASSGTESSPPSPSPISGPGALFVESSPPLLLSVPASELSRYLSAALRLWNTELRPRFRPNWLGDTQGCSGEVLMASGGSQLLLAALEVPIVPPGLNEPGHVVTNANDIVISEDARPWLLHLRFLQEWLIQRSAPAAGPKAISAGIVNADGSDGGLAVTNALQVLSTAAAPNGTEIVLTFSGYAPPPTSGGPQYLVKVTPWPAVNITDLTVVFARFQNDGFVLRASKGGAVLDAGELAGLKLMIEVTRYS